MSWFERADFTENVFLLKGSLVLQNNILTTQTCVTSLLKKINIRGSAGPYSICMHTQCYWADELSNVLTKFFQMRTDCGQIHITPAAALADDYILTHGDGSWPVEKIFKLQEHCLVSQ